ncbi:PWI domain-containing protein [Crassisporium funariophilum]|nr:PWI domain-containing protein [Crassisporium funariophilum]
MADAGFFKGTSADQDRRFSDKEVKLLKSIKFPAEFDKKVDMRKVNLAVIRPWIAKKIIELIGFEDEVVVEYAMGLLEDEQQPTPDPRKMQINLTGFLTKDTPEFMSSLWKLLLEAQSDVTGVPRTFVEQKKEEMRKAREGDTRAIDERDRRARLDELRDGDRGGRGGGRGRGGRGGFDDDRGGNRNRDSGGSREPPPRRRSRSITPRGSRSSAPMRNSRYRASPPRRRSLSRDNSSRSRSRSAPPPPPRRRSSPVRRPSPPRRSVSRSVSRSPPPQNRRRPRSPSVAAAEVCEETECEPRGEEEEYEPPSSSQEKPIRVEVPLTAGGHAEKPQWREDSGYAEG